jgi:SAM-dependent methyltransferase
MYHERPGREYFAVRRFPVFQYLACLVARAAPLRGRILDIGGAQGHLMSLVRQWRPDLATWVNDVSGAALRYAVERFRLPVILGGIEAVRAAGGKYHVVVMSDVLYYEPDLPRFWATLPDLLEPRGLLLIRMPNKLPLLRAAAWVDGLRNRATRHLQDRVRFFNPQHAYVMSRAYLYNRLRRLGFDDIRSGPSPMLGSPSHGVAAASQMVFRLLQRSGRVLGRSLHLTPSFVMSARWAG